LVGIAIDATGDIYVSDWRNDRIQKFNPERRFLTQIGLSGAAEGELTDLPGLL